MPTNPNTINLINTKTGLSPQLARIETSLRRAATVAIIVFLAAGLLVGALYFYYSSQLTTIEATRTQLRGQISAAKNSEGLLISIKDRTRIVEKAMDSQRPLAEMLELLSFVAVPPALSSVSVDEDSKIEISIQANTIDEILPPIEALIAYANDGRVRSPELRSVQFGKDGTVSVSIAFNAVF